VFNNSVGEWTTVDKLATRNRIIIDSLSIGEGTRERLGEAKVAPVRAPYSAPLSKMATQRSSDRKASFAVIKTNKQQKSSSLSF
jgi:hypothetical protein